MCGRLKAGWLIHLCYKYTLPIGLQHTVVKKTSLKNKQNTHMTSISYISGFSPMISNVLQC